MADPIPLGWLPAAKMKAIVFHWTAGPHKATAVDRKHYHFIIEADGTVVRGNRSIVDNVPPLKTYAAHTKNFNSNVIGISVACMAGAVESPLKLGDYPMTRRQFEVMASCGAQLGKRYGIPVHPKSMLWHAEVQGTLGIQQAGKWDATVLAFEPKIRGAKACGDYLRNTIQTLTEGKRPVAPTPISQMPPMKTVPTPFDPIPFPSPQVPGGGIIDTPDPRTAGPEKEGSGGRVGLWLAGLFAVAVTGGAVWWLNPMGWW